MRIAIYTAVCDADAAMAYPALTSVLRSLSGHSIRVCIVDDATRGRVGEKLASTIEPMTDGPPRVIRLPQSLGFRGCSERTRIALKFVAEEWADAKWVLHVDPDTLVLRPSLADVLERMDATPRTVCGFTKTMRIKDRVAYALDLLPVGLARRVVDGQIVHDFRRVRGKPVWWARAGLSALRKGFAFRFAGGGFYWVCGELLQRILAAGYLRSTAIGNHGFVTSEEDVLASTLACAVGGRVTDLNESFPNLGNLGIGDWTPESLAANGVGIIHPVKATEESRDRVAKLLAKLGLPPLE